MLHYCNAALFFFAARHVSGFSDVVPLLSVSSLDPSKL